MTKFSIQIENQFGYSWPEIKKIVEDTEKYGYYSFYSCDHFFLDNNSPNRDAIEAYSILSAAAVLTKRIKLGSLVTGNNYRNPAMLAKILASVDAISSGRIEVGIGAGWKKIEYEAYGFDFPSVKDRMDMLEESVQIIQKLFNEESPSFNGKHYTLNNAQFSPRPDKPMFMIGGGGEKRTLKMVAKYADYCNLFSWISTDDIVHKLKVLENHCNDIGRDYSTLGKSLFTPMSVFETSDEVDAHIKALASRSNSSEDDVRIRLYPKDTPGGWVGTPDMLKERIEYFNSLGFDYYFFQQPFNRSPEMIEKFAKLVMKPYF